MLKFLLITLLLLCVQVGYGQNKLIKRACKTSDLIVQGDFIKGSEKIVRISEGGEVRTCLLGLEIKHILKKKKKVDEIEIGDTIFVPIIAIYDITSDTQKYIISKPVIDTSNQHCIYFLSRRKKNDNTSFNLPVTKRVDNFPIFIWVDNFIPAACLFNASTLTEVIEKYRRVFND